MGRASMVSGLLPLVVGGCTVNSVPQSQAGTAAQIYLTIVSQSIQEAAQGVEPGAPVQGVTIACQEGGKSVVDGTSSASNGTITQVNATVSIQGCVVSGVTVNGVATFGATTTEETYGGSITFAGGVVGSCGMAVTVTQTGVSGTACGFDVNTISVGSQGGGPGASDTGF